MVLPLTVYNQSCYITLHMLTVCRTDRTVQEQHPTYTHHLFLWFDSAAALCSTVIADYKAALCEK